MSFERARRPEQKALRRQAIVDAAALLVQQGGLDSVSLSAIAREAGMAKSAIYRYFEGREHILLELLVEDEAKWVVEMERALAPYAGSTDPTGVGNAIADTLIKVPRLCRLSSILPNVLEQNLSEERVRHFKRNVMGLSIRIANALHIALPVLSVRQAREVHTYAHALVAGLWPITHPAPVVAEVLATDEFETIRHDFEKALRGALCGLIRGLCQDPG